MLQYTLKCTKTIYFDKFYGIKNIVFSEMPQYTTGEFLVTGELENCYA